MNEPGLREHSFNQPSYTSLSKAVIFNLYCTATYYSNPP